MILEKLTIFVDSNLARSAQCRMLHSFGQSYMSCISFTSTFRVCRAARPRATVGPSAFSLLMQSGSFICSTRSSNAPRRPGAASSRQRSGRRAMAATTNSSTTTHCGSRARERKPFAARHTDRPTGKPIYRSASTHAHTHKCSKYHQNITLTTTNSLAFIIISNGDDDDSFSIKLQH